MLLRVLKSIRRRPKHVRDRYAFWIAASMTGLVVTLWAWQLPNRFSDTVAPATQPAASASAFSSFINEAKERFSNIGAEVTEVVETIPSEVPTQDPTFVEVSQLRPTSTASGPASPSARPVRIATTTAQ